MTEGSDPGTVGVLDAEPSPPAPARGPGPITARPWFRPAVGAAGLVALGATASGDDGPVLCPFRFCTGGYCPGCGMTRSIGALVRGDLGGSWQHHPFLLIAVAQLMLLGAIWSVASGQVRQRLLANRNRLLAANGVALVLVWLLRLATGQIPVPFS